jgi:hypothetical protein
MPYTEEDNRRMGEIADATLVADIKELTQMLEDKDLMAQLIVSGNRKADPDFVADQSPGLPARGGEGPSVQGLSIPEIAHACEGSG